MPKTKLAISRFVICVENKGYKASLEKRKVYISVPDAKALKHGHIRVVDEFNKVWDAWVVAGSTPARACIEARLQSPKKMIEIQVTAAR